MLFLHLVHVENVEIPTRYLRDLLSMLTNSVWIFYINVPMIVSVSSDIGAVWVRRLALRQRKELSQFSYQWRRQNASREKERPTLKQHGRHSQDNRTEVSSIEEVSRGMRVLGELIEEVG